MIHVYDVEVLENLFAALFIKLGQDELIKQFIDADIHGRVAEKNKILQQLDKEIFVIYGEVNDLKKLYAFLKRRTDTGKYNYLSGYNNTGYDDIVMDYIVHNYNRLVTLSVEELTKELKELNDYIIDSDEMYYNLRNTKEIPYNRSYKSIDLQSLNNLHNINNRVSLKQCSISLKWYKIEDYEMPPYTRDEYAELYPEDLGQYDFDTVNQLLSFNRRVHMNHFNGVIEYLYNDVFITYEVFKASLDEINSRFAINAKYRINTLSSPRSGTAEKVMRLLYSQYTGLDYRDFITQRTWRKFIYIGNIIKPNIKFKSKELIDFLTMISTKTIDLFNSDDSFKFNLHYKGKTYVLGLGGLHSKDLGGAYTSTDDYDIIDADVDSYYPRSMITGRIKPEHLSSVILNIFEQLLKERLHYKSIKDKSNAGIYKIVLNAIFGKLGDANSIFKDDRALYSVTVNNQLYLIMLIEDLELNGISVISANTDGVTAKVPKSKRELYDKILNDWCNYTGFTLEVNRYSLYVRTTVNDYFAVVDNGDDRVEIKRKGDLNKDKYKELSSGYLYPVVPKALEEYYINDVPIETTILNETDILNFCMSQKTGSNFKNEYHTLVNGQLHIETLTKNLRYYACNSGGILLKRKKATNTTTNILKGVKVNVLNKLKPYSDIKEYDVNYNFYIAKARDLINKINNAYTKVMKKTSGTLFDNLDDYE